MQLRHLINWISTVLAVAAVCQGQEVRELPNRRHPARIAFVTDTHVNGPQYELGQESNPLDNESVVKTQQRLWAGFGKINKVEPGVDVTIVTGDFVHDGFYTTDYRTLAHGPVNAYQTSASILSRLDMPYVIAYGNHDFQVKCHKRHPKTPRWLTEKIYRHFYDAPPYQALHMAGWKILVLNSMLGHTYDSRHKKCDIRLSSYGRKQLEWAASHLAEGKPTIVAMHHPLPTSARGEAAGLRWPDIVSLLSAHDNVKLVLTGHYHKGYDWGDLYPFAHRTLPALRYSAENYFLLDLYPDGSFNMPDWEKNKGGSRCSHTWRYSGWPKPADADTPGDCGLPLFEDTDTYQLPPISHASDIPDDFNPEQSCALPLAKQLLAPCLHPSKGGPPSEGCCSLLATQFQHGSDRPFDGCLCKPDFWAALDRIFADQGINLTASVQYCAARLGALVFYRGAGACPPAPHSGGPTSALGSDTASAAGDAASIRRGVGGIGGNVEAAGKGQGLRVGVGGALFGGSSQEEAERAQRASE